MRLDLNPCQAEYILRYIYLYAFLIISQHGHGTGGDNGYTGVILGLHPANEKRRYFVMTSLIGWAPT